MAKGAGVSIRDLSESLSIRTLSYLGMLRIDPAPQASTPLSRG